MRALLDTSVFLWLQTKPERIGDHVEMLEDPETELLFSAASSWEIAIKYARGKLPLPAPPPQYVPERMREIGAVPFAVEHSDALAVAELPAHHRDPFDRLLVAQARRLDVPIVTADEVIARYPVATLLV